MKKGFTLVEMLAVIVVLGLLALIAIPTVLNKIKSTKEDLYDNQIEMIKSGATNYVTDQVSHLKSDSNFYTAITTHTATTFDISLNDLQLGGFLEKNISNPLCDGEDKYFSPTETKIKIKYDGKEFSYEVFSTSNLRESCTAKIDRGINLE